MGDHPFMLQDACVGSGDLLPGLCSLAQQWLRDVALPGFRDMPAHSVSLTDWYSDKRVSLYLQVQSVAHLHDHNAACVKLAVWQRCITTTHCVCWLPYLGDGSSCRSLFSAHLLRTSTHKFMPACMGCAMSALCLTSCARMVVLALTTSIRQLQVTLLVVTDA